MNRIRSFAGSAVVIALTILGQPEATRAEEAPHYEVDVYWPEPLPDRWVLGGLGGVCVDDNDHVFILNRQDVIEGDLNGGKMAPSIIEFDPEGYVVNAWGDPKLLDARLHSCHFDGDNNMWIAAAPSGMVQKYTHDGSKLLQQIGTKGVFDTDDGTEKGKPLNSNSARFHMPSSIFVDRQNGDIYVSDGESPGSNRRVVVLNREGKFLRQWLPEGMDVVHCMTIANDGQVYVCNRYGSRIQIYDKMGKWRSNVEVPWAPVTPQPDGKLVQSGGSAVALAFSPDPTQKLMFVLNQNTAQIDIFERSTGKHLSSFGRPGSFSGEFNQAHGIAVDSKGNVYVAENRGRRVHKFTNTEP
jgi:DNA-binding beta-propeller fold protein YncE